MRTRESFRASLWFFVASIAVTSLHELSHAGVAYSLGVRSTLFSYLADLDLTAAQAATSAPALIGIAGPSVALVIGVLSWVAYRRGPVAAARLPLFFVTVFGVGTFCGNMMSAAFVGDFSRVATLLHLPMPFRILIAALGGLSLVALHFWAGRELVQGSENADRVSGALTLVVIPVVLGTAAIILVNQPTPRSFMGQRIVESAFWLFAAIGATMNQKRAPGWHGGVMPRWADGAAALVAIVVVRLMVAGVPFTP